MLPLLIICAIIVRILATILPDILLAIRKQLRIKKAAALKRQSVPFFDGNYIEVKNFYIQECGHTPCIAFINDVDSEKVQVFINQGLAGKILAKYQRSYYSWMHEEKRTSKMIFMLSNNMMIELGEDYAEILYRNDNPEFALSLLDSFSKFKALAKDEPYEINIITLTKDGLDLKQLEIKSTELDVALYYNDDFKVIDQIIRERLNKRNDKGIILLHGLPGTGKTTYLRHLIGSMKKKVLFVSPGVASNLMNPEFIDLLIDNPNAVLVIEDAENIIMDRRFNSNSSVSNLLNISDGLLSDCLNVQIICTFNNSLSLVDSALLRKGRLIAKYEFGKLEVDKAQRLSNHLGLKQLIDKPMTLAEIANPGEIEFAHPSIQVIGFRREEILN